MPQQLSLFIHQNTFLIPGNSVFPKNPSDGGPLSTLWLLENSKVQQTFAQTRIQPGADLHLPSQEIFAELFWYAQDYMTTISISLIKRWSTIVDILYIYICICIYIYYTHVYDWSKSRIIWESFNKLQWWRAEMARFCDWWRISIHKRAVFCNRRWSQDISGNQPWVHWWLLWLSIHSNLSSLHKT